MRASFSSLALSVCFVCSISSPAEADYWHHGCYPQHHHYWPTHCYVSCYTPCYQPWYPVHHHHFASYPSHHHHSKPPCPECPSENAIAYHAAQGHVLLRPLTSAGREGTLTQVLPQPTRITHLKENYHDDCYVYFDEFHDGHPEPFHKPTGRIIRIARCPKNCLYEISVLDPHGPIPNKIKYVLLMCARRECLPSVPAHAFAPRSYSEELLEEAPAPSRTAIPSNTRKAPVRVERKTTKDFLASLPQRTRYAASTIVLADPMNESVQSVILVHRPATLELDDDSRDSIPAASAASISDRVPAVQPVVRSRVPLRGEWGTPSETKIVANWNDGAAARSLPVVQVSPPRRTQHDLKDEEVILVSGLEKVREE